MHTAKPTPKSPIHHLDGMPPYLMMKMEERIMERLKEYVTPDWRDIFSTEGEHVGQEPCGDRQYTELERAKLARWILHRMMQRRMDAGKQFDSILESSRQYFAEAMLATALEPESTDCDHEWIEYRSLAGKLQGIECRKCRRTKCH